MATTKTIELDAPLAVVDLGKGRRIELRPSNAPWHDLRLFMAWPRPDGTEGRAWAGLKGESARELAQALLAAVGGAP